MRKYLVATHRKMAEGIVDTIRFFTGDVDISAFSCYLDDNDISDDDIKEYVRLDDGDELVIFTDIESGSVTQKFYPYLRNNHIFMIVGISMPLVLSIILADSETLSHDMLEEHINEARNQMKQIYFKKTEMMDDE